MTAWNGQNISVYGGAAVCQGLDFLYRKPVVGGIPIADVHKKPKASFAKEIIKLLRTRALLAKAFMVHLYVKKRLAAQQVDGTLKGVKLHPLQSHLHDVDPLLVVGNLRQTDASRQNRIVNRCGNRLRHGSIRGVANQLVRSIRVADNGIDRPHVRQIGSLNVRSQNRIVPRVGFDRYDAAVRADLVCERHGKCPDVRPKINHGVRGVNEVSEKREFTSYMCTIVEKLPGNKVVFKG